MGSELKTASVVGLVGAAAGAGLALGIGLRLFSVLAMVGLGTGVALGLMLGGRPHGLEIEARPTSAHLS